MPASSASPGHARFSPTPAPPPKRKTCVSRAEEKERASRIQCEFNEFKAGILS